MEYKQFRKILGERTGQSAADVEALSRGLIKVMRAGLMEMDSVAIPTFGTFTPHIQPDSVSTDLSTGKRILLPPEINIEFHPGAMLLKRLRHE